MKNLFKISTIAFAILSLFVVSCAKERTEDPKKIPIGYTMSWAENLGSARIQTYKEQGICNNGKWGIKIENAVPNPSTATVWIDPVTGAGYLIVKDPGTFDVIITYTCDDGTVYKLTIPIIAK